MNMKTGINNAIKTGLVALGFFGILATTASAAYFDNAPAPKCDVQITYSLSRGSEGVQVTVLQNFLNRAGYLSATPNGYFGPATTAAVRAFQASNGLSATGSVGPMTRNAINERMCDTDLRGDSLIYDGYGYGDYYGYGYGSTGVTYVNPHDPFVQVITPNNTAPNVYVNPQNFVVTPSYGSPNVIVPPVTTTSNPVQLPYAGTPATTVGGTPTIIYSPSNGYLQGVIPAAGTLTITSPSANSTYNEGDTVNLSWTTNNLSASQYTILIENTMTGQSKAVTTTSSNYASFVLSKDLLDAVCAGACTNYNYSNSFNQSTYRFVVTTPYRDIASNVTTFRAMVSPITIKRPYAYFGTVSITANKNPVNNNEVFKLYVNIPTGAAWNANIYSQYSFKIRANCPSGVNVIIAGVPCGQDFVMPYAPTYYQSEIPTVVTNTTWYKQDVTYTLTVTTLAGQVIGTAQAVVSANGSAFTWPF
jgi:peptidoglycan hydrolase-like protein with peptidoglycan-binding domain